MSRCKQDILPLLVCSQVKVSLYSNSLQEYAFFDYGPITWAQSVRIKPETEQKGND